MCDPHEILKYCIIVIIIDIQIINMQIKNPFAFE